MKYKMFYKAEAFSFSNVSDKLERTLLDVMFSNNIVDIRDKNE